MRFLQTADLHLGKSRKLPDYLPRQQQMLRQIFSLAKQEQVDALVIAGDIYDRTDLRDEERNIFLEILLQYDGKFPILIINGNHCMHGHEQLTALHFLKTLENHDKFKSVHIAELEPRIVSIMGVDFALLPYRYYNSQTFATAARSLVAQATEDKIVVVCHECINGASTDTGWKASHGFIELPNIPEVTFWALGDIHKQQAVRKNAHYPGSPIQHTFGDAPTGKGVLLVDTDHPTTIQKIPLLGIKPLLTLTEVPDEWPDAYIRIVGIKEVPRDLPDDVIYTSPQEQEPIDIAVQDDILQGLIEVLADRGLKGQHQAEAIELATGLLKSINVD